jgi:hypothetical protein
MRIVGIFSGKEIEKKSGEELSWRRSRNSAGQSGNFQTVHPLFFIFNAVYRAREVAKHPPWR